MTPQLRYIITTSIRCFLILLFCYTAVNKWLFYNDFLYQLKRSPFIPAGYTFLSVALPVSEIALSVLLTFNTTARAGLALSAVLLFVFTVYIVCMLSFAPFVPCSCGGFISTLSWPQHIALNGSLLGLALIGYWLYNNKQTHYSPLTSHR